MIDGAKTATLSPVTAPTTLTYDGQNLTLVPNEPPIITVGKPSSPPLMTTNTGDHGQSPAALVVVIDGTKTATFLPVTTPMTVTTDSQEFTLVPDGPSTITIGKPPSPTTQTSNPPVAVVIGTELLTFPPVTQPTIVTTGGRTLTLMSQGSPSDTIGLPLTPPTTLETGITTETEGSLPTFTEWPPDALIIPVDQEVEGSEPEDDDGDSDPEGAVLPCKL